MVIITLIITAQTPFLRQTDFLGEKNIIFRSGRFESLIIKTIKKKVKRP
jgi:hypothetical protein